MLNVRFIVKMLGVMFILETFFMLAATVVAFLYRGSDVYPILISSGILFGTGFLFYSMGFKANEHSAGRREGMLIVTLTWILFSLFGIKLIPLIVEFPFSRPCLDLRLPALLF